MITFCRCGQGALSPEQQQCSSEWLRWEITAALSGIFSRNSVTLHAFKYHSDANKCFASSQTQAHAILRSLHHAVILFGKDGQAEVNSDLLPWTSTCAAGSSNRVSAEEAGMSGRYLELVLTDYGEEKLRHLLPSFEGETGMVDISASKPDKCTAGEMVLPFLQGTEVDHHCVSISLVWHLLDRLSGQSALISRTITATFLAASRLTVLVHVLLGCSVTWTLTHDSRCLTGSRAAQPSPGLPLSSTTHVLAKQ